MPSSARIKFALIPLFGIGCGVFTVFLCLVLARVNNHIDQWLSPLSLTGVMAPESYFYSLGFIIAGASLVFSMVMLNAYYKSIKMSGWLRVKISIWTGALAAIGLMVQAAVPLPESALAQHSATANKVYSDGVPKSDLPIWAIVHVLAANMFFFVGSLVHGILTISILKEAKLVPLGSLKTKKNAMISAGVSVVVPGVLAVFGVPFSLALAAVMQYGVVISILVYYWSLVQDFSDYSLVLELRA